MHIYKLPPAHGALELSLLPSDVADAVAQVSLVRVDGAPELHLAAGHARDSDLVYLALQARRARVRSGDHGHLGGGEEFDPGNKREREGGGKLQQNRKQRCDRYSVQENKSKHTRVYK